MNTASEPCNMYEAKIDVTILLGIGIFFEAEQNRKMERNIFVCKNNSLFTNNVFVDGQCFSICEVKGSWRDLKPLKITMFHNLHLLELHTFMVRAIVSVTYRYNWLILINRPVSDWVHPRYQKIWINFKESLIESWGTLCWRTSSSIENVVVSNFLEHNISFEIIISFANCWLLVEIW